MSRLKENTPISRRALLSTLWIFATLCYLYCDLLSLMDPNLLKQYLAGNAGGMEITQGFLVGASVLMLIPISMVLVSRILDYKYNRWANIIAGSIMTLVQVATLFIGQATGYYILFSIVEISATAAIVWTAWKWISHE